MNIRSKILSIRRERDKSSFISYFKQHHGQLDLLISEISELSEYPYKEYASWILTHLARTGELNIQQYYTTIVDTILSTNDQTVLRNLVNTFTELELEDYRETELMDQLIQFLQDPKNKVALHVYSIYALIKFVKKYPELFQEIEAVIDHNQRGKSAAFHVARRNFYRELKNIHSIK